MPCNAAALSQHHARQATCNFVPSKQATAGPSSKTCQCNHCGGGRGIGSSATRMKSASNQCSIRSSASSSISILSSKSLNNDHRPSASATKCCQSSSACCHACSCAYSIKSSKSLGGANTRPAGQSKCSDTGDGDSIKIVIMSGSGSAPPSNRGSGGGGGSCGHSSNGTSNSARSINKLSHCLYQPQAPTQTTQTHTQTESKARSNNNQLSHEHHECSRQPGHTRSRPPPPSSRTNTVCQSRCPTISDISVGNRQLPCSSSSSSSSSGNQSQNVTSPSSSAKCASTIAGVSTPAACACGKSSARNDSHRAAIANGHARSPSSASSTSTNTSTSGSCRQHAQSTSKHQQHHSSMCEREVSKVSTASCRSSCSSSASCSSAFKSQVSPPSPRCLCELTKNQLHPEANWPPQSRQREDQDQACQECKRQGKREAKTMASADAKCYGETVETEVESASSGCGGRSGETRARQRLSALFESAPPPTHSRKHALVEPAVAQMRPASRCSAASGSTSASVVSSSSISSSSASSRASFSSSHAALSAYTTSSISMRIATPNKPQDGRLKEAELLCDENQNNSNNNNNNNNNNNKNNNNNESDFPDAYASLDIKAAAAPPPPPPPPPPPLPPTLPPLMTNSLTGGTASAQDDPLRRAVAKRLHLSSTCDLLTATAGGDTAQASTKSTVGSVAGQRRPPSVSAMAAFIPPQFAAPPKDGTNIKPSEYLKRVNSNSTLSTLASSGSGCTPSSITSSGVSSQNQSNASTPIGSLSSSTGASLISRTSLVRSSGTSASASEEDESKQCKGEELEVITGESKLGVAARASAFEARQQAPALSNRFRQLRMQRQQRPAFELQRSQSTSALNKLEDEREDEDETASVISSGSNGGEDDDHLEGDSSCSSTTGSSDVTGHVKESPSISGIPGGSGDVTSNLMNELRSFDKSKLARMMARRLEVDGSGAGKQAATGGMVSAQASNKLDHLLAATKRDLIAELKESKDLDGIKRMRECHKGGSSREIKQVLERVVPVFKPEDFLDKIAESEPELPLWRRQMLAKKAADRARKEHEEQVKLALEEKRLSQVPQWKRQMMAKKAAERNKRSAEEEKTKKDSEQRHLSEMPTWRRQLARIKITASTGSINTIGYRETETTTDR